MSRLSLSADQHCERRRQTLLLPPLHLCRGHREHPAGVQRLPGHHPENAPAAVRTLVMGDCLHQPSVFLSTILHPWGTLPLPPHPTKKPLTTPDHPSCRGLWSTTEVCQILFLFLNSFLYFFFFFLSLRPIHPHFTIVKWRLGNKIVVCRLFLFFLLSILPFECLDFCHSTKPRATSSFAPLCPSVFGFCHWTWTAGCGHMKHTYRTSV